MTHEQLYNLISEMRSRLKQKSKIDELLFMDFFSAIAKMTLESDKAYKEFDILESDAEAIFTFSDSTELPSFSEGACWGALRVRRAIETLEREPDFKDCLASNVITHYDLLNEIRNNPGITQQELAEKLGKKKSNLSQILGRLNHRHLIIVSPRGRFKTYFITSIGVTILKEIDASVALQDSKTSLIPHGMEQMQVGAIYAYNEHRDVVIDTRGSDHKIVVPKIENTDRYIEEHCEQNTKIVRLNNRDTCAQLLEAQLARGGQHHMEIVSLDSKKKSSVIGQQKHSIMNMINAACANPRINLKYLFAPRRGKIKRVLERICFGVGNNKTFAYIDDSSGLPFSSYMVVDDKTVITRSPTGPNEVSNYLLIQSADMVSFYKRYFEALWEDAHQLNTADSIEAFLKSYTSYVGDEEYEIFRQYIGTESRSITGYTMGDSK